MACDLLCGWILYDIDLTDDAGKDIEGKITPGSGTDPGEHKKKTEKALADLKDPGVPTKPVCTTAGKCHCEKVGDPSWAKDFTPGWTLTVPLGLGWLIVYSKVKVKLGRQDGVCSPDDKKLSPP